MNYYLVSEETRTTENCVVINTRRELYVRAYNGVHAKEYAIAHHGFSDVGTLKTFRMDNIVIAAYPVSATGYGSNDPHFDV